MMYLYRDAFVFAIERCVFNLFVFVYICVCRVYLLCVMAFFFMIERGHIMKRKRLRCVSPHNRV